MDAPRVGVLDFCIGYSIGLREIDIVRVERKLYADSSGAGAVYVVPAGTVNEEYVETLACLDLQEEKEEQLTKALKELLEIVAKETKADYIFMDSRAGFHEIAGIALAKLSHGVVLFGNTSSQSMAGLSAAVQLISNLDADQRPFLAFAHGLARPRIGDIGHMDYKSYKEMLFDICETKGYYLEDEFSPNIDAQDAPHVPISFTLQDGLREGIRLAGEMEETQRMSGVSALTQGPYKELAQRILEWRGF
jgi:hypothetical protein